MPHNPIVLLVRHGRTELNDPQRPKLRAWENPPLDKRGILDAKMAAQLIKRYQPQMVYSSDLTRDLQTAQILSQELGNIPFEVDYDLRTANMGTLSGMDEKEAYPWVEKWYKQPWWQAPGGGESNNGFLQRFYPSFDTKFNLAKESEPYCPSVVVSHGRNLAAIHARCEMIPQERSLMPLPGGIMSVYLDDVGEMKTDFFGTTEPILSDV